MATVRASQGPLGAASSWATLLHENPAKHQSSSATLLGQKLTLTGGFVACLAHSHRWSRQVRPAPHQCWPAENAGLGTRAPIFGGCGAEPLMQDPAPLTAPITLACHSPYVPQRLWLL